MATRFKKQIAWVLAAAILALSVPLGVLAAPAEQNESQKTAVSDVWTGEIDTNLAGAGTQDNPYQIETAEQLAAVVSNADGVDVTRYFVLTADIRLNDTEDPDWMNQSGEGQPRTWYGSTAAYFAGTIDGQGHTVSGLYFDGQLTETGYALFAKVTGATIKNIGLIDSYVKVEGKVGGGATYVGGIAGQALTTASTVSGCYVDESVFLSNQAGNTSYIGGIVAGGGADVTVDGCYVLGTLEYYDTAKNYGAIVGYHWANKTVTNCYAVGVKLIGDTQKITENSKNNYCTEEAAEIDGVVTVVDSSLMQGEAARENMPLLDWTSTYYTTEGYPEIMYFSRIEPGTVWTGMVDREYAGGEGTAEDPYRIETAEQLAYLISADIKTAGKYYALTADIRLNDTTGNWTENNPHSWYESSVFGFYGTFCGQGHAVSGLYYNDVLTANTAVGLFPRVFNAVIQDVGLTYSYLCSQQTDTSYVGGIVGLNLQPAVTVIGCYVDSTVTLRNAESTQGRVGGIIGGGGPDMVVDRCYFLGTIEHHADASRYGAIFGDCWNAAKKLNNCYAVGVKLVGSGSASADSANNYSTEAGDTANAHVTQVDSTKMQGAAAKEADGMTGLDYESTYYWTTEGYPALRIFGVRTGDITGDGVGDAKDIAALRKHLLGAAECGLADFNENQTVDVTDLIRLKKMLSGI